MRNKKNLYMIIAFILLYILQFLILPLCTPRYFPISNEASGFYFGSFLVLLVFLEYLVSYNVKACILADLIYLALVTLFHGKGLYGIGFVGISLDGAQAQYDFQFAMISIAIFGIYILLMEIIVKMIFILFRKIFKLKNQTID